MTPARSFTNAIRKGVYPHTLPAEQRLEWLRVRERYLTSRAATEANDVSLLMTQRRIVLVTRELRKAVA